MSYKKDKRGKYRVEERWLNAWRGGKPEVSGFCYSELREYSDGAKRVVTTPARSAHSESQETAALLNIYLQSRDALIDLCER